MRPALFVVLLAGCYRNPMSVGAYTQYGPGWPRRETEAQDATNERHAGCLDFAVSTMASAEAGPNGVLVRVRFGNRCDRTVPIDFTRIRARVDGGPPLVPNDPRRELRPTRVEARTAGDVRLEFYAWNASAARNVCVDWVEMTTADEPTPDRSPICVAERE